MDLNHQPPLPPVPEGAVASTPVVEERTFVELTARERTHLLGLTHSQHGASHGNIDMMMDGVGLVRDAALQCEEVRMVERKLVVGLEARYILVTPDPSVPE